MYVLIRTGVDKQGSRFYNFQAKQTARHVRVPGHLSGGQLDWRELSFVGQPLSKDRRPLAACEYVTRLQYA